MTAPRPAVVLLFMLMLAPPLAAQAPWATVPAFSTRCYLEGDPLVGQLDAARVANQEAVARQEQVNQGLDDQLKQMDPAMQQSKMMAYMQQNPTGFQAYIAAIGQNPESLQTAVRENAEGASAFDEEFRALLASYAAEKARTVDPLQKVLGDLMDPGSKASAAQVATATANANAAYKALCDKWIVAGKFPAFLARFKEYMNGKYLPHMAANEVAHKRSLEVMGISTKDYKSTEPLKAVGKYMDYAYRVYMLRPAGPVGRT